MPVTERCLTPDEIAIIKKKFTDVKAKGYIRTHRGGNTGIGKTLEDELDIEENNHQATDILDTELKAARSGSQSMLTLITKTPQPDKAAMDLLERYGYPSEKDGKLTLLCTLKNTTNTLKHKPFCKIEVTRANGEMAVAINHITDGIVAYWKESLLRSIFQEKYPYGRLFYVKAASRGSGVNEEFWYNEAYLYSGLEFDTFIRLVREGIIKVDLRIGQYPDGRLHDHGTGLRIKPVDLHKLFPNKVTLL